MLLHEIKWADNLGAKIRYADLPGGEYRIYEITRDRVYYTIQEKHKNLDQAKCWFGMDALGAQAVLFEITRGGNDGKATDSSAA